MMLFFVRVAAGPACCACMYIVYLLCFEWSLVGEEVSECPLLSQEKTPDTARGGGDGVVFVFVSVREKQKNA